MRLTRLALVPVVVLGVTGFTAPAFSTADPLADDAVAALAVEHCQPGGDVALTAEELAPTVLGTADVEVVPGEISVHVVRLEVSIGEPAECTVAVLHRDVALARVAYTGTVLIGGVETVIELGNMGKSAPVDPTTEVALPGSVVPSADVVDDPAYEVSLVRKALETVPIAVNRSQKNAAARLLKAETRAAAVLLRKQLHAAGKSKGAEKALAAAERNYDRRIARARAAFERATAPKSVTRPVGVDYTVSGTVARADVAPE